MKQILWLPAAAMSLALATLPEAPWRADDFAPTAAHSAEVYSLVVTPATATIETGRSVRLSARLTDGSGRVLSRKIRWTSSNPGVASVNQDGDVKGVAAGSATITGSALSGRAIGRSSITVTDALVPPPPTTTTPTAIAIFGDDFESGTLGAWQDGYNAAYHRVITDATLARSGSRVLEVSYAEGGEGGFLTRFFMPGYDSVRVSYWVRFPTNWQGSTKLVGLYASRIDNQWSAFGKAGQRPNGTDFAIAFLTNEPGPAPGVTHFYTYFPDMVPDNGTYWGDIGIGRASYTGSRVMSLGSWHKVELWAKLNTPGQNNGVQRFWIDGVLQGEWTGLRFRDTDQLRFNSVQLTFNRAGSPSLAAQKLYVDDLQVTGNVASGSSGGTVTPPPAPAPAPVAAVAVSPSSATVAVGATQQLAATTTASDGTVLTGRAVAWSTSSATVATVSATGVVTGIAAGTATVTATSETKSATATITVVPPAVASVTLAPTSASLTVGQTQALSVTLRDAAGATLTGRTVTWASSSPAVATVSSSGVVTAASAGSATITATSEGRTGTASITVTAPAPTPPPSTAVMFGEDFESGSMAAWQDGYDPSLHRVITDATLARSGNRLLEVNYVAGGSGGFLTRFFMPGYDSVKVSYWVRFPTNWQGSTKLVGLYASRIDNQWSAFGKAGQRPNGTDFAIAFLKTEGGPVPGVNHFYTYFPDMVPDNGTYWGDLGIGRASYTGSRVMSLGAWHHIEFWAKLNTPGQSNGAQRFWVDGVLQGEWTGIRFRDTDQLRLNALQLTFDRGGSSSTVAQKLYVDDVRVFANAASGSEGSVTPPPAPAPAPAPVASVSVSPASGSVLVGGSTQLSATLRDASGTVLTGRSITWSSTNPAVATVSSSGAVTGVAAGSASIRATSEGQVGTASITVTAPAPAPVASVTLAPSSLSLQVGQTATVAATLRSSVGTVLTGRTIAWSSTNTSVATVSSSGTVTAVGTGNATIRATSEGITGSAGVAVTAIASVPQPPAGSLAFTNAPAGLTVATNADWTSWPSGWVNERASTTGIARLATDATAPMSPSGVLEEFYPAGMTGGTAPGNLIFTGTNGATEVFVGFWFKMSENFTGHSSGVNKLVNLWTPYDMHWLRANSYREYDNDGTRANGPFYLITTNRSSEFDLLQNQVPSMIPIVPGKWHKVEWHLQTASAGPGNGRVRFWLDGVLVGDYSNLSSTMGSAFSEFQISPTWGGTGGTMPADSYMRFDQVFISRR